MLEGCAAFTSAKCVRRQNTAIFFQRACVVTTRNAAHSLQHYLRGKWAQTLRAKSDQVLQCSCGFLGGGRTRTRTWDPLIKSSVTCSNPLAEHLFRSVYSL